jgi:predicted metal-binding membrane protein
VPKSRSAAAGLEGLLRRDRVLVLAGLCVAIALSWAWLVPVARDMYGTMGGPAAWMMAATWDIRYFVLMVGMWAAMMLGMMLPAATPTILLYARVVRGGDQPDRAVARSYVFAGGYVLVWTAFSVGATLLQWTLSAAGLLSPMMELTGPRLGGAILVAAGVYQFTALKRICLTRCRSPMTWLPLHWKPGLYGALRMGAEHGLYCVGCCWVLMLLLFAGGVLSLAVIGAITVFVLLEKLAPFGAQGGRLSGVALVTAGALVLAGWW